jgi:16S rRNA (guanine966-N2)-methyltransferase
MRVVAGTARGRRLVTPPGTDVRPTTDRVREATFNALGSLGALAGAEVLDLFAGSGALGVEALSRGAARATFVDRDRAARRAVETNVAAAGVAELAEVVADDALRHLARRALPDEAAASPRRPFDLVLLDPPYAFDGWLDLFAALEPHLAPDAVVVVESDRDLALPPWAELVRAKAYGSTVVTLIRRTLPTPSERGP